MKVMTPVMRIHDDTTGTGFANATVESQRPARCGIAVRGVQRATGSMIGDCVPLGGRCCVMSDAIMKVMTIHDDRHEFMTRHENS